METVIQARGLCKRFRGGIVAVDGLDLEVPRGAVYGLMGCNGAGKTTTLRLLTGLLRPDAGTARLLGADFWTAPRAVRQRVAYVSQAQQLPTWMTLEELCRYGAHFYDAWDRGVARDLARRWDLPWQRPVARLSGGAQRQAAILLALAAQPEVLLLDEPAAGLDPVARRSLLGSLVEALSRAGGCTVLLSTHLITDLERVAEYVGIMDRGGLTTSTRLEELLQTTKRVQVVFDQAAPPPGFTVPGALRSRTTGPVVFALVRLTCPDQLEAVRRLPGTRLDVFTMGLEEIFIELLQRGPEVADEENEAGGWSGPAGASALSATGRWETEARL